MSFPSTVTISDLPWIALCAMQTDDPATFWALVSDATGSGDVYEVAQVMLENISSGRSILSQVYKVAEQTERLADAVQELQGLQPTVIVERRDDSERTSTDLRVVFGVGLEV